MKEVKNILVIDGSYLTYKSYFAFSKNPLIVKKDDETITTSVIVGFLNEIISIERQMQHDAIIVVWDKGPYWKSTIDTEYKMHRKKLKIDVYKEVLILKAVLYDLNIPSVSMKSFEGEEVAHSIFKNVDSVHFDFYTNDEDCFVLLSDNVTIINNKKGDIIKTTAKDFKKTYKFPPKRYRLYKTLTGCKSDNVKGVHGLGPKRALAIAQSCKNIKELKKNLWKFEMQFDTTNLLAAIKNDEILRQRKLVTIARPKSLERFKPEEKLSYREILAYLEANSFLMGQKLAVLQLLKKRFKNNKKKILKKINAFILVNN